MGWTLSNFIRGYRIRAECTPVTWRDGLFYHKCTLYIGGMERRKLTVPYVTSDPNSIRLVTEKDEKTGKLVQVYKSRVSVRELLFSLACEVALYEIAKRPLIDSEGNVIGVDYNIDLWASIVFRDAPLPPPWELERLYQNTRRIARDLRIFLEGREAAETRVPTIYRTLISETDEVASFVYNWVVQ